MASALWGRGGGAAVGGLHYRLKPALPMLNSVLSEMSRSINVRPWVIKVGVGWGLGAGGV